MNFSRSTKAFALATALLTAAFSGTALQVTALGAGGVMLMAGEATARNNVPGVGTVVKKRRGGGVHIAEAVTDENGEVVFTLEPGEYSITVGNNKPQDFTIGEGQHRIKVVVTGIKKNYVGHVTLMR
jgi:hypothetical protein